MGPNDPVSSRSLSVWGLCGVCVGFVSVVARSCGPDCGSRVRFCGTGDRRDPLAGSIGRFVQTLGCKFALPIGSGLVRLLRQSSAGRVGRSPAGLQRRPLLGEGSVETFEEWQERENAGKSWRGRAFPVGRSVVLAAAAEGGPGLGSTLSIVMIRRSTRSRSRAYAVAKHAFPTEIRSRSDSVTTTSARCRRSHLATIPATLRCQSTRNG